MRKIILFFIFFGSLTCLNAQSDDFIKGKVSYKSANNVYVRFNSTSIIESGDTLFIKSANQYIPALIVFQKSSISVVTTKIADLEIKLDDEIFLIKKTKLQPIDSLSIQKETPQVFNTIDTSESNEVNQTQDIKTNIQQIVTGRISLSTNASLNNQDERNYQRIRASVSLNVANINNGPFSVQSFLTYRHRYGIDQIQTGFNNDFKVYTLAGNYNPNDKINLWVGRKINNNIANIGAIDGVQYEYKLNSFIGGLFAGSRPDFTDYTFNPSLIHFGGYLAHQSSPDKAYMQSSLAFAQQMNNGNVDRRFLYFQHQNSRVKNLNLFFSTELDVFQKINDIVTTHPEWTSFYASARYRIFRGLSISASYDKRRNIIFYESYQTFIDQLLAQETRQGLRFQVNFSPFKFLSINVSQFLRYQGELKNPTKNFTANLSFIRMPVKNLTASLNYNTLETSYHNATILGGRLNYNLMKGRGNVELNYRRVDYLYNNTEQNEIQNIYGSNLSYSLLKATNLILSYEATVQPDIIYHRYFITLTHRIKSKKK